MKKQIKYPFLEDQTFYIGLISNDEYFYISNVKPIDKYIVDWVGEDEWELKFEVPQFSIGYITIVARLIDNAPDSISLGSYFVSTQNNEQDIKNRIINYNLHRIKSNLEDLEKEKKEYLVSYSKLSKYLLN